MKVLQRHDDETELRKPNVGNDTLPCPPYFNHVVEVASRDTSLDHGNIVPLLNTVSDFGPYSTGMVSPWMDNGDLNTFFAKMNSALSVFNRFQIVRAVPNNDDTFLHRFKYSFMISLQD